MDSETFAHIIGQKSTHVIAKCDKLCDNLENRRCDRLENRRCDRLRNEKSETRNQKIRNLETHS